MSIKKEKFQALVSKDKTDTVKRNRNRIKNRARLRESRAIAMKVLDKLEELNWTKAKLAEAMEVSPQQISKIVRGSENLTLETQVKIQEILDIPILASYYEKKEEQVVVSSVVYKLQTTTSMEPKNLIQGSINETKVVPIHFLQNLSEFTEFTPETA